MLFINGRADIKMQCGFSLKLSYLLLGQMSNHHTPPHPPPPAMKMAAQTLEIGKAWGFVQGDGVVARSMCYCHNFGSYWCPQNHFQVSNAC